MRTWFAEVKTLDELRQRYKTLLKQYHPDSKDGDTKITQEINSAYDRLFAILSKETKADGQSYTCDNQAENEAFKEVLSQIAHINATIEVVGSWIWISNGYEYRALLKSVGFKYAPRKKAWCWHYGEYRRHHKSEVSLDQIRSKYGSKTVSRRSQQYSLD